MAGHSHWAGIKHKKGLADKKRGKLFGKLSRAIIVAAQSGGGDPDSNLSLRYAIERARKSSMPKDNIERAIQKGCGDAGAAIFTEIVYEGYGVAGVAVLCVALTDNRNRTASEVRAAFTKHGGSLGETNSVSFQFDRIGAINYPAEAISAEEMFEAALEASAIDVNSSETAHEVVCAPDDLHVVREALEARFDAPQVVELQWKPQVAVAVGEAHVQTLFKLLEALDDNDDVRSVSANYEVDDAVMATLSG